jgi:BirA family transcriptional regulator, biotin operon repressor / biotin---[acetyl-CoA-carboxylase] ligase
MQPSLWTIERHAKVGSTMDVARERARAGAPHGTVVVADEMTGGRGTQGRPWVAPVGGLYLSIVLRGLKDPHLLTLALGNAVAETLEVAGVDPRLKWVNDVLVGADGPGGLGKKMAGILVEAESTGSAIDFLVVGIGVNVNGSATGLPGLAGTATTLEDQLRCDSCIPDLEVLLLDAIDRWVAKVRDGRTADIVAAFRSRDALKGHRVKVTDGRTSAEGVADGIDDQGRLLVRASGGVQAFASGSVQVLG